MIKKLFSTIFFISFSIINYGQVGIGTDTPNPSAILDIDSNEKGVLIPRMTESERNLVTTTAGSEGLLVYQTDGDEGMWYYDGTYWNKIGSGITSGHWETSGDDIYNGNTANVGVGTGSSITAPFHVSGTTIAANYSTTITHESNNFNTDNITPIALSGNTCNSGTANWYHSTATPLGSSLNGSHACILRSSGCVSNQMFKEGPFTANGDSLKIEFSYYVDYDDFDVGTGYIGFIAYLYDETDIEVEEILTYAIEDSNTTYSESRPVTPGHIYSLRFEYISQYSSAAEVDDILVTEEELITPGNHVFKLEDGTQGPGKVLTSDANGNAYWAYPSSSDPVAPLQPVAGNIESTSKNSAPINLDGTITWIEEFGTSKLINGEAHINLDSRLIENIDFTEKDPFHVFIQEEGKSNGLYVVIDEDKQGFKVQEKDGGTSGINFNYTITAKAKSR